MKQEIKQFGKTVLWDENDVWTSIPMIFRNLTGQNYTGQKYRDYIEDWIQDMGFKLGPVELWEDGHLVKCGEIKLPGKEVRHG